MRSAISSSAHSSVQNNHLLRRFIVGHRTPWLVFLILGAVLLSSVLAGARNESVNSAAGAGQRQSTKSVADVLNHNKAQADPGGMPQVMPKRNERAVQARAHRDEVSQKPKEERLTRARSFNGDLRDLPHRKAVTHERPEREQPQANPSLYSGTSTQAVKNPTADSILLSALSAAAPAATMNFDGLDFATFGGSYPPNANGDVGPTYYIQSVDGTIGIFTKSDGVRVAALNFNTFMSQGNFGNPCDSNNKGDAIVIYDSFEDRWIISDFAFTFDASQNVNNPPGSFQCIAASKTGDPVAGGWNYYSINTAGGTGNNAKFGIWPDGLYMSVNMLTYGGGQAFLNPRVYALNKAQMYAGAPTVQSVSFDAPATDNHLLPSHARLQTGTPPTGSPNYFVSLWNYLDGITVYRFHVDWNRTEASTFSAAAFSQASSSWPAANVPDAPSLGGNNLKVIEIRAMMQNQYSNIGGAESLWTAHTVRRANTSGFAAPRWYQANVTGGTVAANLVQASTWDPDANNVIHRFLPSLAVNRVGDMAIGYTTSSSSTKPAIKYAGRLATDPINTFSQTEQVLIQGTGTQLGNCGGVVCNKWGAYSAMSLDPDGCTFWFTSEYYDTDGLSYLTRIGSFSFPGCTAVGNGGALSGTVSDSATTNPISGATVVLGSRTTTTNASGAYTFSDLPAGTYPSITASFAGYNSSTATDIVVADATTTTQNFSLTTASTSACFADTSQSDFQTGAPTNVELTTSPGDVKLVNVSVDALDQTNSPAALSIAGNLTASGWSGQTFRAGATGKLTKVTVGLGLNSGTSGTVTVEIRDLSGITPGTIVLATSTLGPVTNIGTGALYTTTFATPADVVSGTSYSIVLRTSVGNTVYAVRGSNSGGSTMANGQVFTTTTSGSLWNGGTTDLWLRTYVKPPISYSPSGNLVVPKDANPLAGQFARWLTLSWTATTPANTNVQFQAAASNNIDGPFNFVGPDGTASTFFTSGASLSQFNGFRYLKYQALLGTTDSNITPSVNDVTVCFDSNTPAPPTITPGGPTTFCSGGSVTLTSSSASGNQWYLDGNPVGGATNQQYIAAAAGDYTDTVTTNGFTSAHSTATTVAVNPNPASPTITPDGPTTFCSGGSVTLTSSSASGNQWYLDGNSIGGATNQAYNATASGNYTTSVTANGCPSAPSSATAVTVNPTPPMPTITPSGPMTFCENGSVTLTSSSASGNQWYLNGNPIGGATNQIYLANASGNYTTTITASSCPSAPSAATTVTVNPTPATPTITPGSATMFCEGVSVTLTSSSATGNQWYLNGNPIGGATTQQYNAASAGDYTVTVTTLGCSSAPSTATAVTANTAPTLTYATPLSLAFGESLNVTPTMASDNGTVSYQVLAGHGLATAPIVSASGVVSITNAQPVGARTITVRATDGCGATTEAGFALQVQSPANVSGTKTVSGDLTPGGSVTYTLTLSNNSNTSPQLDNSGNEFTDVLSSSLTLVAANASSGVATANVGTNTVIWNGSIPAAGSITITITGAIKNVTDGTVVSNQGTISYDADGDGTNEATRLTDDPSAGGANDPTIFTVGDVNDSPDAVDDALASVAEDSGTRTIPIATLLANDSKGPANESGQTLTLTGVSNPIGGTVSSDATNVYFTPAADFNGAASFKYTITDNGTTGGSSDPKTDTATVSIKLTDVNDAPVAVNDRLPDVAQAAGSRLIMAGTLAANDSKGGTDENGQTLTIITVGNAEGGTVAIVDGDVVFTPTTNYSGPVIFSYTVEDNGTTNGSPDPKTSGPAVVQFNITGSWADTPSVTSTTTNANTQTTSGLVISRNPFDGAEVTNFKITGITGGSLFKHNGIAPINDGDFITFAEGNVGLKFTPGDTNGSFLVQASTSASDAGVSSLSGGTAMATIAINPMGGVIRFSAANYSVAEGGGLTTITVERSGDISQIVEVDYASGYHSNQADSVPCTSPGAGQASSRCDFTTAIGTLKFAVGETSKTFNVLITNDNYVEGTETLELTLSNPTNGAVFGVPQTAILSITDDASEPATNPIDNAAGFVRAQYHDILGREPDAAGLAFWTDNVEKCNDPLRMPAGQTVAQCIDKQRESIAIAFFQSPEFQITSGFVYHLYKGSLTGAPSYDGGSPNSSLARFPTFLEFMHDMSQVSEGIVVGGQISGPVVEANRNVLAAAFVERPEFIAKYGGLNHTPFVDELFNTTGIAATAAEKQALVDGLTGGTESRASVLRKVVDGTIVIDESNVQFTTRYGQAFISQENNRLFVFLEYIGYLRRSPDTAGFVFWLGKLNQFNGDPVQAEMVRSFILSPEYRSRFGQP